MNKTFRNEPELDFSIAENRDAILKALETVDEQKGADYPIVINGEKIFVEKTITSINPCKKDEVIGRVAAANTSLAHKAVNAAYRAFNAWRKVDVNVRIDYVQRLIGLVKKHRAELAAWMIEETGKNYGEADGEICEAIDFFNAYSLGTLELEKGIDLVDSETENNRCKYTPIGVGIVIPPWNFPFSIMAGMAIAAVITGNTVVIKPASDSPVVAYRFFELCEEAGFPKGVINYLPGSGGEVGDFLVRHPKTRFINFTGSKAVGLRINKLAADPDGGQIWIKRVVAEMGGKNAIIVDDTADIDSAARGVAVSAFGFQGQKCSACSRAIVVESVYDEFCKKLKKEAEKFTLGAGRDNSPLCAVINQGAFDKITEYIKIGKKEGKLLCGGKSDSSKGFYIEPTAIKDVDPKTARIAKEEIFGPVVAVMKVKDFNEALKVANDTEYGLTGSLYSNTREHIVAVTEDFHVGNLYINRKCTGAVVHNHPFGGFHMSGTTAKTGTLDYLYNFVAPKAVSEYLL